MAALAFVTGIGHTYRAVTEAASVAGDWAKASVPGAKAFSEQSAPAKFAMIASLAAGIAYYRATHCKKAPNAPKCAQGTKDGQAALKKERTFFQRLGTILQIIVTGRFGKSLLFSLLCLSVLLLFRTLLSIQVAVRTGNIAEQLVQRNWEGFVTSVGGFLALGVPAAFVNSALKYFTTILQLYTQKQLTDHINQRYIQGTNFYKATQLPSSRIENVDQRVTADVHQFSQDLASLYSSVFKPILDILLNTAHLASVMGLKAPFLIFLSYVFFGKIQMTMLQQLDIKNNTKRLSEYEGTYRTAHSRLITYAEEISFFEGGDRERDIINGIFNRLFEHHQHLEWRKAIVGVFDQFLLKYATSITGYALMAVPVFFADKDAPRDTASLTRNYVLNRQLLMDLSIAIGTLLSTATTIASFAGITQRVSEVLEKVEDLTTATADKDNFRIRPPDDASESKLPIVPAGAASAGAVSAGSAAAASASTPASSSAASAGAGAFANAVVAGVPVPTALEMDAWLQSWRQRGEDLRKREMRHIGSKLHMHHDLSSPTLADEAGSGYVSKETFMELGVAWPKPRVIVGGERIRFFKAAIVSPDGRLLCKDLDLTIARGENVMVTGPNGCGKSSLFRVLGELWPPFAGTVVKPAKEDVLFVPQKPYLVNGTLRDQIIYPHTAADMKDINVTDEDLVRLLDVVDPARSITREWRFDDVRDWFNAFSGGQKQRVAMARVFYHRPRYAILDECTSAVSADVEGAIYRTCKKLGVTIFTVSHRPNLQQYHDIQLRFDGAGGYSVHSTAELSKEQTGRH